MGESFTIQISANLLRQLSDDADKLKKKAKKPKAKLPREPKRSQPKVPQKPMSGDSETLKGPVAAWPHRPPFITPVTPSEQHAKAELNGIRSVVEESERIRNRLQETNETMLQEVTQRAKELRDNEFKLPEPKPMPCLEQIEACLKCYKENTKDPLKCANVVEDFATCTRRVRLQVNPADK